MRIAPAPAAAPPAQCYAYAWTGYLEVLPVAARACPRLAGKVRNASDVLPVVC